MLFSTVAAPVCIPTNSAQGFPFLHILGGIYFSPFFFNSILTDVRLYFIVALICISLMINWASFHGLVGHLYVFFGKISICIFCPFLNQIFLLLLSCRSCLYILNVNPLSDVYFANIFFHSVGCLFILLMVSFAVQKLFSLM